MWYCGPFQHIWIEESVGIAYLLERDNSGTAWSCEWIGEEGNKFVFSKIVSMHDGANLAKTKLKS